MNRTWFVLVLGLAILPAECVHAADGASAALDNCRGVVDASARLSCYDAISVVPLPSPAVATEAAQKELGAEQLPRTVEQIEKDKVGVKAFVTRCTRAVDKKYILYLENGQVWKQKSDKRLFFKECRFEVEISKDFFGYKMSKIGEASRFRVSRIK